MAVQKPLVHLFTDGACLGNPGPGGWAALLRVTKEHKHHEKLLSGGTALTTNNRMEMQAVIEGLHALKTACRVKVHSDSKYVIKGITEWIFGWIERGWKNSARKPVENQDLWEELLLATKRHEIEWQWVKGHSGHAENERVDEAAREAALNVANQA